MTWFSIFVLLFCCFHGFTWTLPAPPPNPTWEQVKVSDGVVPPSRQDHVAAQIGDTMVIYGGWGGPSDFLGDLWAFNPQLVSWKNVTPVLGFLPKGRADHSIVNDNTTTLLISFGGGSYPSDTLNNCVLQFLSDNSRWEQVNVSGTQPSPRNTHSAVLTADGVMLVYGGFDGKKPLQELWSFDMGSATWTQLTASGGPPGLLWHTAVIIDQQMIVYGGVTDPISGSVNADVWSYDINGSTWKKFDRVVDKSPVGRAGHVAMVKDEMMYVFGGQGAHSTLFNDTWMFDPSSNSWTELQVAVAPSPRLGHKGLLLNNSWIIFGGSDVAEYPNHTLNETWTLKF